ncbi:MAG: energy transducer TonB [Steroidobacteraceae bacterium]
MAESPAQRSRDENATGQSAFAPVPSAVGLLALTQDALLIEALRAAVDARHRITIVATDGALTDHLLASQTRAVLIDSAACHQPIAQLTGRLKAQFPDLVLVVAGTSTDQGSLASQITDGRVYRFLHKPVSAQRVKLFVESAFRRSDTAPAPASSPPPARAAGGRSRLPLIAGVVAALAAGAVWWFASDDAPPAAKARGTPTTTPSAPAPAPADLDPATRAVLERADAALARGSLVAPPGDSAADLYREVLTKAPDNARAAAGLDQVVDRLLGAAEKSIVTERLDDATRLVGFARSVRPDHPRVAFLTTQIGKERERQLLAAARQAAAGGDLDRAIAVLEGGSATGSELLGAAKRELQQREAEQEAANFLAQAIARTKSGALLEPAQDNARFYLESARALAPRSAALAPVEQALRAALAAAAGQAIAAGDFAAAERWIVASGENGAAPEDLTNLRRELQRARIDSRSAALTALGEQLDDRLRRGLLVEPANDSARSFYLRMRAADPQHPATLAARDALGKEMLAESRIALARSDLAGAEQWVAQAEAIGIAGPETLNARRDIATLRARVDQTTEVVPVGRLKVVRRVEPRYPPDAQARGEAGWVELEFTVTPGGTVGDVRVVDASAAGVFDEAASDALARWRFKPVERNGVAVPQRARLRIRFDLQ